MVVKDLKEFLLNLDESFDCLDVNIVDTNITSCLKYEVFDIDNIKIGGRDGYVSLEFKSEEVEIDDLLGDI